MATDNCAECRFLKQSRRKALALGAQRTILYLMKTTERTVAKVELYNHWNKGSKFPGNGYYVAAYEPIPCVGTGFRRLRTLKDFGRDEAAARAYAELWNGPELDAKVNAA